ncbi:MAG: 16S rRNA (cytidine(1402)-2'-O)-methyltransferase [Candidatus Blackburnbacteria bacterium]|nr:16S rRNA (cytidine(1402)-2'-O)-methyltransferase [Candidatus Blackburnbacteria bacterium]
MGKLSIVSSPIGNLEDITLRAIRVLGEADLILAEDTRTTAQLLNHYGIQGKNLESFFEGNEERKINLAIALLKEGKNISLLSESGTPLISDPGYKLVRECIKLHTPVETIPGPTALIAALTISGLPPNAFVFLGFLPRKETHVKKWFNQMKNCISGLPLKTVIFYESPHRILKTLYLTKEIFGDVEVAVARELTKLHEEIRREKVSKSIEHFTKTKPRGEFVILLSLSLSTSLRKKNS